MICKLYFTKAVKRKSSSSSYWLAVPLTFSSLCPPSPLTCLTAPFPGSRMECWLAELDSHFPHSLAGWPGQVTPSLNFVFLSVRWRPKCLLCLSLGLLWGLIVVHWKVPYKMKAFGKMAKINNPRNKADALILKKKQRKKNLGNKPRKNGCLCPCGYGGHTCCISRFSDILFCVTRSLDIMKKLLW